MRKLLIFLVAFAVFVVAASGLPMFGPAQGFRNPGNVEIGGSLSIGGANIVAGTVSYDDVVAGAYTNETAINASITAAVADIAANATKADNALAWLALNETADIVVDVAANATKADNALAWLILNETAISDVAADVAANATKTDNALAWLALNETDISDVVADVAANSTKVDNALAWLTLNETAIGAAVVDIAANSTRIDDTVIDIAANATKADNALAWIALNDTRIDDLVVPLATFDYDANSVDQGIFTASGAWTLTAVKMTPRVLGTDIGAVNVMPMLCDSGEAPSGGDAMLTGTLDLKGTADTPQSGTLSATVAIANGKVVALDFTGTLTSAVGTITLYGTRA
ncbi:hypothetical protein M0R72_17150 [Candidatus Pacearchaeota archaeon]|jgi:hypothetical protein|nr:hypothetical protein [Candidatus Pacearchaeota archaeon]